MNPDRYAFEQAIALRDDWQFSRIFASETARPGFTALLALRTELQNVVRQASEPGIAAMRFEWWRMEIARGFAGNAQHPLARALGKSLGEANVAPEYCLELVDAAETESENNVFTEQDFRLYLYRGGGVLGEQLAMLSGINDRNALNAARRLGQLKRFTDMLLACGAMLRAGHWLFPFEWLEQSSLNPQAVLADPENENVHALLAKLLAVLDTERIETRTVMESVVLPPALQLQWPLMQRDYRRLRDNPAVMLASKAVKDGGIARLWTAWRGARTASKNFS
ncbi:MAG TPA: squalene/phytoene synthase family protein [Gammaproteobacteria bacterium]